jgi:rhamnose utilization protein RhaD (predicted bifunctional aldolase and dehydrogenase)/NAD(P)-dependent dehydrogenase (short-subunit alcohol dehydrogenase family)
MHSRWNDTDAQQHTTPLALRIYTSRLLGADQRLVLHGGGNTSVKIRERNLFGDVETILYIKGSGHDLGTIDVRGFAPVRLDALLRMAQLEQLSDAAMVNAMRTAMTDASAPTPSVEAILHAIIPATFVDHTHADAVLTLLDTPHAEQYMRELYGDRFLIVPYVMPGFALARHCALQFARELTPQHEGVILLSHGIFTWGDDAQTSYERMIAAVDAAEQYAEKRTRAAAATVPTFPAARMTRATLRADITRAAGVPMIVQSHRDDTTRAYAARTDIQSLATRGCVTPDHIIRTRQIPLVGRDVAAYTQRYRDWYTAQAVGAATPLTMLDPAPRIVLDAELGMLTVGRSVKDARIAADVYRQSIPVICAAEQLGGYTPLGDADLFAIEYWELEQAKLRLAGTPPVHSGEVVLVTGAASGIGRACVEAFLTLGAAVVALDINPAVATVFDRPDVCAIVCDISDDAAIVAAVDAGVVAFGGIDMIVLNAGIFPKSRAISAMPMDEWRRTMAINLDANVVLMRECQPLLAQSLRGGRVVIIGSKNVPAPGPGAAAYSASKAAITQLARVAALEWGDSGIRVNVVHPNQVFDTGIWSDDILASRAANYGMSIDDYKKNNILHTTITSHDVAAMVSTLCGAAFSRTTGAQVPIDGGNERVI